MLARTARQFPLVACLVVVLALVPAALAAKGGGSGAAGGGGGKKGGGGTASISLVLVTDANGNGAPNYGDTVTFKVSTTATPEPHVRLQCFQNGTLVNTRDAGMYASYPWAWEQNMPLSSSAWTGGAANCTAQVYWFSGTSTVWSTSLSFNAAA